MSKENKKSFEDFLDCFDEKLQEFKKRRSVKITYTTLHFVGVFLNVFLNWISAFLVNTGLLVGAVLFVNLTGEGREYFRELFPINVSFEDFYTLVIRATIVIAVLTVTTVIFACTVGYGGRRYFGIGKWRNSRKDPRGGSFR